MMKSVIQIILMLCSVGLGMAFGQSDRQRSFDSAYVHIATVISAESMDSALAQAKGLLLYSEDSVQVIRSRMLLATLYVRQGNYPDALVQAVRAEKLAADTDNEEWQTRIAGFLSSTFRNIGLFSKGKRYLLQVEKNNRKVRSPLFQLFIHQEKACYALEEQRYQEALLELTNALVLYRKIPEHESNVIHVATCYHMEGVCYLHLGQYEQSRVCLDKAMTRLGTTETELKGFIYMTYGQLALVQQDYPVAKTHLDSALAYTVRSGNANLQEETYLSLKNYYAAVGDAQHTLMYNELYTESVKRQTVLMQEVSNTLLEDAHGSLEQEEGRNQILYISIGALLVLFILYIIYMRRKQQAERRQYKAFLQKMDIQKRVVQAERTPEASTPSLLGGEAAEPASDIEIPSMSAQPDTGNLAQEASSRRAHLNDVTEQRILKDLSRLEERRIYLRKDLSLPYLAARLKTNTKYLSLIINEHKHKDFNNYINELRVQYIIEKLKDDPVYHGYKISYLAEEAGFSSHSKFSTIFKQVTGLSPSVFIAHIKKDHKR